MRGEIGNLQVQQLKADMKSIRVARYGVRPERGWIRAVREARGVSTGELGRILGVSRQLPLQFEKAEADDSITLKSLRKVADALDCDLVYALMPRLGTKPERSRVLVRRKTVERIDAEGETTASSGDPDNLYFCD
jgi:predicted DNA-binding mobile mystery protein A